MTKPGLLYAHARFSGTAVAVVIPEMGILVI